MLSLGSSWVLVSRLERVGARLGLSEALLGMLAALAADAPEITAAVTALAGHQARIGAGVVIGSNVFNLAALLGLSAVLAGGIALHRRVIVMEGAVALWVAAVCVGAIVGLLTPAVGLLLVLCLLVPYVVVLGVRRDRLRRMGLPARWVSWLTDAIVEEELELEVAIHPQRGRTADGVVAAFAVLVVVGASLAMEQSASKLGARNAIPEIVVGGLILAAVTSLPNDEQHPGPPVKIASGPGQVDGESRANPPPSAVASMGSAGFLLVYAAVSIGHMRPALVAGSPKPRVELILHSPLNDQTSAQPRQLRKRLARVLAHTHRQHVLDPSFYLRRRRYRTFHGVGLLHRLAGLEGTYAVALTAPALFTAPLRRDPALGPGLSQEKCRHEGRDGLVNNEKQNAEEQDRAGARPGA